MDTFAIIGAFCTVGMIAVYIVGMLDNWAKGSEREQSFNPPPAGFVYFDDNSPSMVARGKVL